MTRLVGRRGRRRRLLASVRARLEQFGADHNPATVLDPEAVAELTALLETVPDPTADFEIAGVAGWLHWCRYLVLDPGDNQRDLADALAWFMPVYQTRPTRSPIRSAPTSAASPPPTIRRHWRTALSPCSKRHYVPRTGPTWTRRLTCSGRRWRPARPTTPIGPGTCRTSASPWGPGSSGPGTGPTWTPRSTPGGRRWRPARPTTPTGPFTLSNLGAALETRFERTGDRADLDAAIDAGRQAVAGQPGRPPRPRHLPVQPRRRPGDPVRADRGPGRPGRGDRAAPAGGGGQPGRPPRPRHVPVQPRQRPADPV